MNSPKGLELCEYSNVMNLNRGLYGFSQAGPLWYETWAAVMDRIGFHALLADNCVYPRDVVWILLYVNKNYCDERKSKEFIRFRGGAFGTF